MNDDDPISSTTTSSTTTVEGAETESFSESLDRARDGLDHLQAAARELIAAARAALDVAEGLIDDPELATSVTSAAGRVRHLLRSVAPDMAERFVASADSWASSVAGAPEADESVDDESRVRRIVID